MAKAKYQRGADGYFTTKVWDGTYNANGTKHRRTLRSKKSSGDLEKQVDQLKLMRKLGQTTRPSELTFYEYALSWKDTYKSVRELNTQKMYENIITKHLVDLNGFRWNDLRRGDFQRLITMRKEKPRTCQQLAITIKQLVKSAVRDQLIPKDSFDRLCSDLDLPKYKAPEKRALTTVEKAAISRANFTSRERCFVYLIYGCGLRREEALALKPEDRIGKEIKIRRTLCFDGNTPYIKNTPKTDNGYRSIPLPEFLQQFLSAYHSPGEYLITTTDGRLITKSSYDKLWASVIKKMNEVTGDYYVTGLTAHVFRHNYCTQLCYRIPEISIKKIAQLMGDTEKMVMEVYNHILEEQERPEEAIESAVKLP